MISRRSMYQCRISMARIETDAQSGEIRNMTRAQPMVPRSAVDQWLHRNVGR
jgi:hypothetical protein